MSAIYIVRCTALTGRIKAGIPMSAAQFKPGACDVTDDACGAVAQSLLKRDVCMPFTLNGKSYILKVEEVVE